jgi:cytochrome c-type biogenesis protein CcmE
MTRKQKRLAMILSGLAALGVAAGLVLYAISDTIVFFFTPSEMAEKHVAPGQRLRLGGMVEAGSVASTDGVNHIFVVTDTIATTRVHFKGQLPDLFREGQGVVAEGVLQQDGSFEADTVLAKHDENYMPREVAESLKAKGVHLGKGAGQ